ncbi:Tyrosyl-tRNA synthetase [Hordeum vulgare]|nr:Tyrosyl-tRNA synthetase [Hordeum vulgare]
MMTKLDDYEHEDGTTKMSKPDELHDNAPKSDFAAIPLCGIDYVESSMTLFEDGVTTTTTLFEDGAAMTMTTEPIKEHALEASDKVASKDDASIFGCKSDDVPSSAFTHDDGGDMVEHGIFPLRMVVFGDALSDCCHHIESESDHTTSPICDEFPHFPCEESHNPHHLSEMSDSTICPIYDEAPILDYLVLPLDKTMVMVDDDAPHMVPS